MIDLAIIVPMRIFIINGPNLNLLGTREQNHYGTVPFEDYYQRLKEQFPTVDLEYFQSNVEGELVSALHDTGLQADGIILNAGAYTHTSVALHDAVAAIMAPVIEVHISNVFDREEYRHRSLISSKCIGHISGFGLDSYSLALVHFYTKLS